MLEVTIKIADIEYEKTYTNLEPIIKNRLEKKWWNGILFKIGDLATKKVSENTINKLLCVVVKSKKDVIIESLNDIANQNGIVLKLEDISVKNRKG